MGVGVEVPGKDGGGVALAVEDTVPRTAVPERAGDCVPPCSSVREAAGLCVPVKEVVGGGGRDCVRVAAGVLCALPEAEAEARPANDEGVEAGREAEGEGLLLLLPPSADTLGLAEELRESAALGVAEAQPPAFSLAVAAAEAEGAVPVALTEGEGGAVLLLLRCELALPVPKALCLEECEKVALRLGAGDQVDTGALPLGHWLPAAVPEAMPGVLLAQAESVAAVLAAADREALPVSEGVACLSSEPVGSTEAVSLRVAKDGVEVCRGEAEAEGLRVPLALLPGEPVEEGEPGKVPVARPGLRVGVPVPAAAGVAEGALPDAVGEGLARQVAEGDTVSPALPLPQPSSAEEAVCKGVPVCSCVESRLEEGAEESEAAAEPLGAPVRLGALPVGAAAEAETLSEAVASTVPAALLLPLLLTPPLPLPAPLPLGVLLWRPLPVLLPLPLLLPAAASAEAERQGRAEGEARGVKPGVPVVLPLYSNDPVCTREAVACSEGGEVRDAARDTVTVALAAALSVTRAAEAEGQPVSAADALLLPEMLGEALPPIEGESTAVADAEALPAARLAVAGETEALPEGPAEGVGSADRLPAAALAVGAIAEADTAATLGVPCSVGGKREAEVQAVEVAVALWLAETDSELPCSVALSAAEGEMRGDSEGREAVAGAVKAALELWEAERVGRAETDAEELIDKTAEELGVRVAKGVRVTLPVPFLLPEGLREPRGLREGRRNDSVAVPLPPLPPLGVTVPLLLLLERCVTEAEGEALAAAALALGCALEAEPETLAEGVSLLDTEALPEALAELLMTDTLGLEEMEALAEVLPQREGVEEAEVRAVDSGILLALALPLAATLALELPVPRDAVGLGCVRVTLLLEMGVVVLEGQGEAVGTAMLPVPLTLTLGLLVACEALGWALTDPPC